MTDRVPFGLQLSDGLLVRAKDLPRVRRFDGVCPDCDTALVARRGTKRRWHFAHTADSGTGTCGESLLHLAGKWALQQRLIAAWRKRRPVPMIYSCETCGDDHEVDLSRQIRSATVERKTLDRFVPDLTLWARDGRAKAIAEITVTSRPSHRKLDFAKKQDISVIELEIRDHRDINAILKSTVPLKPKRVVAPCIDRITNLYVSASVRVNGGPGSWVSIHSDRREAEPTLSIAGVLDSTTPTDAALIGIIKSLTYLKDGHRITVHLDDLQLVRLVNETMSADPGRNEYGYLLHQLLLEMQRHYRISAVHTEVTAEPMRSAKGLATLIREISREDWNLSTLDPESVDRAFRALNRGRSKGRPAVSLA